MKKKIKQLQKLIDEIYETEGLTDAIIDLQTGLNQLKHKHNISVEKEKLYKNYVQ